MNAVLVTGAAGFIGYWLTERLLQAGHMVVGLDNLTPYYDVALKVARLDRLRQRPGFRFEQVDLADANGTAEVFSRYRPTLVAHLAAQPGVRYSLENPHAYIASNIEGFLNILEAIRTCPVDHLVYASSSAVYGNNPKAPSSVSDRVDQPVSLYAVTKRSNELMAECYSHLFRIPATGLRFFTVYGPWGRPDMAPILFTKAILEGRSIKVFNKGDMRRDFTYVDDIVEGVSRVLNRPMSEAHPKGLGDQGAPVAATHRIYNIGNSAPVSLIEFIDVLEEALGKKAIKEYVSMQPGDVKDTFADVQDFERDFGFRPATSLQEGVSRFVKWYRTYYGVTR